MPLEHYIDPSLSDLCPAQAGRIELDASPWGGGAVIYSAGEASELFYLAWDEQIAEQLQATIGDPASQTTWELFIIFLALLQWGSKWREKGFILYGDNVAALESALHLKGKAALSQISREVSWRRARYGWKYAVSHLPTEANSNADALSRVFAPAASERKDFPSALSGAAVIDHPDLSSIWACG